MGGSLLERFMRRWRDRAAVRAEHSLEPTLRRRLDRAPEAWAARRAMRAERRARGSDPDRIDDAVGRNWARIQQGRR